jgi:hypothetical protein
MVNGLAKSELFYQSMNKLEKILDNKKSNLLYSKFQHADDYDEEHEGVHIFAEMWEFKNRAKIIREVFDERTSGQDLIHSGEHPLYRTVHHRSKKYYYYLIDKNRVITDEGEALRFVEENTGVKLTDLKQPKRAENDYSDDTTFFEPRVKIEIDFVLDIPKFSTPEKTHLWPTSVMLAYEDYHPNNREMKEEFKKIVKTIDSLGEEFGMRSLDGFGKLKDIKNLAYEKAKSIRVARDPFEVRAEKNANILKKHGLSKKGLEKIRDSIAELV